MFVSLCLACQKPSEREFFVPAGTNLGVKLLTMDTPDRTWATPSKGVGQESFSLA